jgi:hypothetical protein
MALIVRSFQFDCVPETAEEALVIDNGVKFGMSKMRSSWGDIVRGVAM